MIGPMKTTSPKSLEAQQKTFMLLSSTVRLRVVNQLMATPNINLTALAKRTGVNSGTVHTALKALQETGVVSVSKDGYEYYVNDRAVGMISDLVEDAAELQFALRKFRPKAKRVTASPPQLRAI